MSYSLHSQYFLVWLTNDAEIDNLLAELLPGYGFTLDSEHGCYYISADGFDETEFEWVLIDQGLFDVESNFWTYGKSYEVPKHF